MTIKVGDTLFDKVGMENAPIGTVVKGPWGDRTKVGRWDQWFYHGAGRVYSLAQGGHYEVLAVPDSSDGTPPPLNERDQLIVDLWNTRTRASWGEEISHPDRLWDDEPAHHDVYAALADFVLQNFDKKSVKPGQIIDNDGDAWFLCPNGMYSLNEDNPVGGYTRDEIARDHGIKH